MSLPAVVLAVAALGVLTLGAFDGQARHDGADKAAYALMWPTSALMLGVIVALAHHAGWW